MQGRGWTCKLYTGRPQLAPGVKPEPSYFLLSLQYQLPSCPGYEQSNNRFEMHGENKQYTGKETFIIPVAKFHEWTDSDVLQMPCLEMALLHHVCGGLTLWPCSHSAWWVMSPRGHSSCWCKNMTYTHRVNTYIGCFHESAAHREMNNTTMLSDFSPEGEWVGNVGKREIHSFSDTDF